MLTEISVLTAYAARVNTLRLIFVALCLSAGAARADHMVFGSFRSADNAENWAAKLTATFGQPITVVAVEQDQQRWYRVQSLDLSESAYTALQRRAQVAGLQYWRHYSSVPTEQDSGGVDPQATVSQPQVREVRPPLGSPRLVPPSPIVRTTEAGSSGDREVGQTEVVQTPQAAPVDRHTAPIQPSANQTLEWELGLQTRSFTQAGEFDQDRFEGSVSLDFEYFRSWDNDRQSVTVKPFLRVDSADARRTHADLRELFYSRVGDNWDLHVGAKRIFWGVTEFHHLIDIINQTDLIENIDTEDRLGQPMVQLSLVRNWGVLDLFALVGFRERTFAGSRGRLRGPLPILDDGVYESAAEQNRIDAALRWSHYLGPFELGVHHFSGTSRDPLLTPVATAEGPALAPFYPVIDQTGIDAQALFGDWALKFEGFSRSGFGDRYAAFNIGFERTLVGIFRSRADLGVVVEYLFDERGDDAINTIFENDIALGGRLALNDFADTQALFGVIVDTDTREYFVNFEGSRRLAPSWSVNIEARIFGGGEDLDSATLLSDLLGREFRSASFQRDDYVQIEIRKFL